MVGQYQAAGKKLIDVQIAMLGENPTSEQLKKLENMKKQIVPYFPLVRDGSYWLDVMLPVDEESTAKTRYTFTYKSEAEANRAQKDFQRGGLEIDRAVYKRGVADVLQDGGYAAYNTMLNKLASREITNPKEIEVNKKIIATLSEAMMDFLPSEALLQQYKKRQRVCKFC